MGIVKEYLFVMLMPSSSHRAYANPEGGAACPDPPENHKNIGFLRNTGPDRLKNHKTTKPAFNVGPPLARRRNAI